MTSSTPLDRITSASPPKVSTLRERLNRPKVRHAKTAPPQLSITHEDPQGARGSANEASTPTNTALNAFKFTLTTLSSASENLPVPGFKCAVDILLAVINGTQVSYIAIAFGVFI